MSSPNTSANDNCTEEACDFQHGEEGHECGEDCQAEGHEEGDGHDHGDEGSEG